MIGGDGLALVGTRSTHPWAFGLDLRMGSPDDVVRTTNMGYPVDREMLG